MSSLLDNHPNIIGIPDCILLGYYEFWEKHSHLESKELVPAFVDYYAVLFDAKDTCKCPRVGSTVGTYCNFTGLGPNKDERLQVDRNAFSQAMEKLIGSHKEVSRKLFFQALHSAYAHALGRNVHNPTICYGLHVNNKSLVPVEKHMEDFQDTQYLLMVRHPARAIASEFKNYHAIGNLSLKSATGALRLAIERACPVPLANRAKWRAVKLEDLHRNPRQTMEKVCQWIGLPWDDSLLKSTVNGLQWWNEKNGLQVSGPNEAILRQKYVDSFVTAFDRFRFGILFVPYCVSWDYPAKVWQTSLLVRFLILPLLLLPFRIETISLSCAKSILRDDQRPLLQRLIKTVCEILHSVVGSKKRLFQIWRLSFKKSDAVELL
jgi:hypothetical protein